MPIVLAIEPDRRQAAHVSAVVRHRVGAELILADTTEGALDAIGSRVPDLVLVPALLSPQDDAALAAALRVIAAAAHVRTLTIPVFANGSTNADGGGGLFARFRRGKAETPSSVGCDPAVFAEQINEYLREAAEERAEHDGGETPAVASPDIVALAVEAPADEPPVIESSFIQSPAVQTITEPVRLIAPAVVNRAPERRVAPVETEAPGAAFVEAARAEFGDRAFVDPTPADRRMVETSAAESVIVDVPAVDAIADETTTVDTFADASRRTQIAVDEIVIDEDLFDSERFAAYIPSREDPVPSPADTLAAAFASDADSIALVAEDVAKEVSEDTASAGDPAAVSEPEARRPADQSAWLTLGLNYLRRWPVIEGAIVESRPAPADMLAAAAHALSHAAARHTEPPKPEAPAPRAENVEWSELVASLRQDIERRRKQPVDPPPIAHMATVPQPVEAPHRRPKPVEHAPRPQLHAVEGAVARRSSGRKAPLQDEWGFFDPQRCGFAALLAKLDEFNEAADEPTIRKTS